MWPFTNLASATGFSNRRQWEPQTGLPDLDGKVALVTGGNTGIGLITAQELHKKNAKVYIACRSEERAKKAIAQINAAHPGAEKNLVYLPFDLTDLTSAKKAAETLSEKEERLDILVCNAGVMAWPYELKNGVEVQFWNHLGHFALVDKLLPLLKKTAQIAGSSVRVVNVASLGHTMSPKPDFTSLEGVNQKMKSTWHRYGQSKLANILFTAELQERLKGDNIRVNCCHPGNIYTELTRGTVASYGFLGSAITFMSRYAMTPFEGAKTQLYLAASPEVDEKDYRGEYFTPIATLGKASAYGQDKQLAEQLWKLSEETVNKSEST
ncbi:hypothetical protein JCM11641_000502 [Rhodosporidiobolus odoratus]